jgi:tetratricopeptide (TPR) repeat protein
VHKNTVLFGFLGVAFATFAFGVVALIRAHRAPVDPRLEHEQMALDHLQDVHYLFFSPASHADLQAARPDLVAAANEHAFAKAAQVPSVFRAMDHDRQFEALLLSGDSTTYKPLLDHLIETRDFVLTWLDNAVLIFRRRGATPWTQADLAATTAKFQGENQARFLAGAATRLIAIGEMPMARTALDQAAPNGSNLPEYWTALALYDGDIAHWKEAIDALDRALSLDSDYTPAMTTKAQILFGARRYDEALAISDQVVEEHPDDPSMLFMQATISHEAHAYQREIAVLKHLIELADAQGDSTTGYRIYLGQAYAETGDAQPSLEQFKLALNAPDITPGQKKFAEDCIAKIQGN